MISNCVWKKMEESENIQQVKCERSPESTGTPSPTTSACSGSTSSSSSSSYTIRKRRNPAVLIRWLEEHPFNPYPTKAEKHWLSYYAGMTQRQLNDWFANARRNIKKVGYEAWKKKHSGFSAILSGIPLQGHGLPINPQFAALTTGCRPPATAIACTSAAYPSAVAQGQLLNGQVNGTYAGTATATPSYYFNPSDQTSSHSRSGFSEGARPSTRPLQTSALPLAMHTPWIPPASTLSGCNGHYRAALLPNGSNGTLTMSCAYTHTPAAPGNAIEPSQGQQWSSVNGTATNHHVGYGWHADGRRASKDDYQNYEGSPNNMPLCR